MNGNEVEFCVKQADLGMKKVNYSLHRRNGLLRVDSFPIPRLALSEIYQRSHGSHHFRRHRTFGLPVSQSIVCLKRGSRYTIGLSINCYELYYAEGRLSWLPGAMQLKVFMIFVAWMSGEKIESLPRFNAACDTSKSGLHWNSPTAVDKFLFEPTNPGLFPPPTMQNEAYNASTMWPWKVENLPSWKSETVLICIPSC